MNNHPLRARNPLAQKGEPGRQVGARTPFGPLESFMLNTIEQWGKQLAPLLKEIQAETKCRRFTKPYLD
jgi:hypothetical protein